MITMLSLTVCLCASGGSEDEDDTHMNFDAEEPREERGISGSDESDNDDVEDEY